MRRLLASYLAEFSDEILEAEDGVQGLAQLRHHPSLDLILVDWDMPQMNGLEFVQAVRATPAWQDIKILMVTAHNKMEDVGQALEAGATDYLMKPMTQDMVVDKLRLLGAVA